MYAEESPGAAISLAPRSHADFAPPFTRVTISNGRESACHCGLPSSAAVPPERVPSDRHLVLTCTSLLEESLEETIARLKPRARSLRMEVHMATVVLPRSLLKLSLLPEFVSLIVIIDKLDPWRLRQLYALDSRVSEYRIVPSKVYPMGNFLRELPAFIQRKATWSFLCSPAKNSPFISMDELHATLAEIAHWPLTRIDVSSTQHYAEPAVTVTPIGERALWISSRPGLSTEEKAYLEKLARQLPPRTVYSLPSEAGEKLARRISQWRLKKDAAFWLLDHCLVSSELWSEFRRSPPTALLDHFSWNEFLRAQNIRVQRQVALSQSPAPSQEEFVQACRQRYGRLPQNSFYEDFFCFLEGHAVLRHVCTGALKKLFSLNTIEDFRLFDQVLLRWGKRLADFHFELTETEDAVEKVTRRTLSRCYWFMHRLYWRGVDFLWLAYEGLWRVMDFLWLIYEGFWRLYEVFWRLMDLFWLVYKYVLAPTIGFIRTLTEFPPEWRYEKWPTRWRLRATHVAKKFGWLVLKTLRLR